MPILIVSILSPSLNTFAFLNKTNTYLGLSFPTHVVISDKILGEWSVRVLELPHYPNTFSITESIKPKPVLDTSY